MQSPFDGNIDKTSGDFQLRISLESYFAYGEAGVSYADIVLGDAEGVVELYDPNQGARIKKYDVTDKIASDFFMMFCRGRKDVYDLRYTNPKTGKNGYYTQCFNRWDRGCHIQKKDGVRCKDCELRAYKPPQIVPCFALSQSDHDNP